MHRLLLTAALLIGVISGLVKEGTFASFTSTATSALSTFTAGTVTLSAQESVSGALTLTNLSPGSTSTAQVNVQNTGNLTQRYALSLGATGNATLASTLTLTIRLKTANPCSSLDGTVLAASGPLSSSGLGNAASGADSGDRELAPSASEGLCFIISLPLTAPSSLQNSSTTVTYTFSAEQVAGT